MYTIRNIQKFNQNELKYNIKEEGSWHKNYDSAYVFIGGLNKKMNQGDIAIVFSEYGEIVDINLARDKVTGKSKGFCFLAYEDQRSTTLAVDNFNGVELCGRTIKVDHVKQYRPPRQYMQLDSKMFEKDYKPTGPDGRGWGKFREHTQQQKRILQHNAQVDLANKRQAANSIGLQ